MARINIEDSLFKEKSFEKLLIKLGSKRAALGALVESFMLAQKWYKATASDRLIPLSEWEREEIAPELIEVGFAEVRENGIYVRGSEEQFAWLVQRQVAGAKGGAKKAQNSLAVASGRLAEPSGVYPLTPTPTLSPTLPLSLSLTHAHSQKKEAKKNLSPSAAQKVSEQSDQVIGLYFNFWKEKYTGRAPLTGKHFSLLKGIVKTNGVERTSQLLKAFFEMPDPWFIKRRHDVETFNANLNQVAHFADTGAMVTNQQVKQADAMLTNQQLLKMYEGK